MQWVCQAESGEADALPLVSADDAVLVLMPMSVEAEEAEEVEEEVVVALGREKGARQMAQKDSAVIKCPQNVLNINMAPGGSCDVTFNPSNPV